MAVRIITDSGLDLPGEPDPRLTVIPLAITFGTTTYAAALSSKRVYPLHSSFRPTLNMAVNLLNSSDYETARVTLDQIGRAHV